MAPVSAFSKRYSLSGFRQPSQRRWNRAGQRVVVEVQVLQVREASQRARVCQLVGDRTGQRVHVDDEEPKAGQVSQPRRHGAGQPVPAQVQRLEVGQASQRAWNRAGQVVPGEVQPPELRQVPKRRGDAAGQRVPGERQRPEARQVAERGRNGAGEVVASEVEPAETGQAAQRRRQRAGEAVEAEIEPRDRPAASVVTPCQSPSGAGVFQAGAVRPVLAAGRVVERLERRPIRRGAVLRERIRRENRPQRDRRQGRHARRRRLHGRGHAGAADQRGAGRPPRSGSNGSRSPSSSRWRGIGSPRGGSRDRSTSLTACSPPAAGRMR